jgi:hypothetical protein
MGVLPGGVVALVVRVIVTVTDAGSVLGSWTHVEELVTPVGVLESDASTQSAPEAWIVTAYVTELPTATGEGVWAPTAVTPRTVADATPLSIRGAAIVATMSVTRRMPRKRFIAVDLSSGNSTLRKFQLSSSDSFRLAGS